MRGYVFTRINTKPKDLSKGGSNGENSENTSTTPSFSANVARSFRKASIGFAIPLPRKFKLPKFPSNVDQKIDTKNNGSRQLDYEARSLEVKVEVQPSGKEQSSHVSRETVSINKRVPHHQTATLSTQAFCLFDNKIQENVLSSVHCNPEEHTSSKEDVKILDPKKDTESSVRPVDNINVSMPQISHLHTDDIPRQGRRESVANCKANTCPNKADIDLPNLSSRKSRADSGIAKKTSCIEKGLATSGLEQDTVRNVRTHDTTNALLEVAQEDNISNGKMSDIEEDTGYKHGDSGGRKTAHLQEKILEVLNDRDLRRPIDERNQKNSTSDPIETDSEQKRPTTDNRSAKIKSKHNFKRTSLYEFDRRELAPRYRRRNHLQCGALIKNNPPQKDVFAFDEHEQSLIGQQFNLVVESEQKHRKPDKSKDDNHLAANCESPLVHKQCTIDEDHEKEHKEFAKSENDHRIAENGSPPAVIYRYSPAAKDTALKENDYKTRDCIHDDHQFDTTAISMNLRNAETPPLEKVCLFQNTQQARKRKRRLVENNIANDIKQSPERMIPPVNDGLPFLKEMPAFFTNMESPIPDIDYTIKANSDSENVVKTLRIEGSRRSRRRNREFGQTRKIVLNLHTPPLNGFSASVIDGEMQLLAELVQKTMTKIKSKASTKSCQILASAMDAVQQRCQEVQEQIQADLDQCTKTSQKTFEQLQLQLEEQHEAFTSMQTKWRSELNESLNRLKEISLQVESSQNLLKSVSDKYKNSHRRLFSKMGEFVDTHLCETEQKLIALRKRSKCIRTELRDALLKIF
ncbi:hypothetical protein KP509_30G018900 [Ceratopteris richardii]|uniref:Uncharacterized protein n=1 Tax=Ceratopteris richardii TaxID=49495 RepID=A0A8T2R1H9_CERRI|nr:hypothetical protein KP509_30G018900 [Ceratopteris richardii]